MQITDKQAENCRVLYAMMAGIPKERINLDVTRSEDGRGRGVSNNRLLSKCGSVACVAGFASAHPYFIKQGLRWRGGVVLLRESSDLYESAKEITGSSRLFDSRNVSDMDSKAEALERIREHLLDAGRITHERNEELIEYERTLA